MMVCSSCGSNIFGYDPKIDPLALFIWCQWCGKGPVLNVDKLHEMFYALAIIDLAQHIIMGKGTELGRPEEDQKKELKE